MTSLASDEATSGRETAGQFALDDEQLEALMCRPGSPKARRAVDTLVDAQLSRNLSLLQLTVASSHEATSGFGPAALALLQRAQTSNSGDFRRVLTHPHVSRILSAWCRQISGLPASLGRHSSVAAIAAAAGIQAGVDFEVTVPLNRGVTLIPSMGVFRSDMTESSWATVIREDGTVRFEVDDHTFPIPDRWRSSNRNWEGMAKIGSQVTADVDVTGLAETTSDIHPVADPYLVDQTMWEKRLDEAAALLVEHHSDWIYDVQRVIETLSVLDRVHGHSQSVSSVDAFGDIQLTLPDSAATFAETLVHEVQHNKLHALTAFCSLVNDGFDQSMYAPWRPDARPLHGMVHGIYAFFGVTHYWRNQIDASENPADRSFAEFSYVRWLNAVIEGAEQALASQGLTVIGQRCIAAIHHELSLWPTAAIPLPVISAARRLSADRYVTWNLRNFQVDRSTVRSIAHEFAATGSGDLAGGLATPTTVRSGHGAASSTLRVPPAPMRPSRRMVGLEVILGIEPERLADLSVAETAYARQDYTLAMQTYSSDITESGEVDAWAGLASCFGEQRAAADDAFDTKRYAESLRGIADVYAELDRLKVAVDPTDLIRWMSRTG